MAAFSSYYTYMPFPVDPLLFPTPNSVNTTATAAAAAADLNFLFCPSEFPSNAVAVKGEDGIIHHHQIGEASASAAANIKKQSTTTAESSSTGASDKDKIDDGGSDRLNRGLATTIAAVNNRRRKTRNCSTPSYFNSKDEREGGKAKRQKKKNNKKGSEEEKEEKKGREEDPPKDYIHVRARRGQATDSHSLAERVRREKISERMRTLQKLVPGCDKVTGKALMLDEIINYVQSLQNQVEFLSMKLASLSPVFYDFGADLDAFLVRPEEMVGMPYGQQMGQRQTTTTTTTTATTAFTDATATANTTPSSSPYFSSPFDRSSLLLPLSHQDNINGSVLKNVEEQRHNDNKFLNTTGFTNNNSSLCSFN